MVSWHSRLSSDLFDYDWDGDDNDDDDDDDDNDDDGSISCQLIASCNTVPL